MPNREYGDCYVSTVKRGTRQIDNPLHGVLCVKGTSIQALSEIGLSSYSVSELVLTDARLSQYLKLSIPPKHSEKVKRILEEHEIAIVCIDEVDFLSRCLADAGAPEANATTLLPEEVRNQLSPLYAQEHVEDPMVYVKYFLPNSHWTWYAYEGSPYDCFVHVRYETVPGV